MARILSKVAIAAAAFCCAGSAEAATILTYTINLTGTGNRQNQFSGGPTGSIFLDQTLIGAVITFGFTIPDDFQTSFGTVDGTTFYGANTNAFNLNFNFSPVQGQSSVFYTGSGTACYKTPQSGFLPQTSVQVISSCSLVSFTGFHPRGQFSDTFSGSVTSITITRSDGVVPTAFSAIGVIPEPSTWALMLAGFAMTGYMLRKRRVSVALAPTA